VRSVAQALGISENVLHRWRRDALDSQSDSELEVEKLRQRLKQRNVSITLRHLVEKFRLQEEARRPLPAVAAGS
jgi:transposase-like protein